MSSYIAYVSTRLLACNDCISDIDDDWIFSFRQRIALKLNSLEEDIRGKCLSRMVYYCKIYVCIIWIIFCVILLLYLLTCDMLLWFLISERNSVLLCEFEATCAVQDAEQQCNDVENRTMKAELKAAAMRLRTDALEKSHEVLVRQRRQLEVDNELLDKQIKEQYRRNQEAIASMNMMMLMLGVSMGGNCCMGNGDWFLQYLSSNNIVEKSCLDGCGLGFNDYTGPPKDDTVVQDAVAKWQNLSTLERNLKLIDDDLKKEARANVPARGTYNTGFAPDETKPLYKKIGMRRQSGDIAGDYVAGKGKKKYGLIEQNILTVLLGIDYDVNKKGYVKCEDYCNFWDGIDPNEIPTEKIDVIISDLGKIVKERGEDIEKFKENPCEEHIKLHKVFTKVKAKFELAKKTADINEDPGKIANLKAKQIETLRSRKARETKGSSEAFIKNNEELEKDIEK